MFVFLFVFCALSALLGQEDTLSDSLNMRLVGVWEAPCAIPSFGRPFIVIDSFVIVSTAETLFILNLSKPDSPYVCQKLVGYTWGFGMEVDPPFLCINGGSGGGDTLKILDVSDPGNPVVLNSDYSLGGYLDWGICGVSSSLNLVVLQSWGIGYVPSRFILLDISDPNSPEVLDTLEFADYFSPTTRIGPVSLSGVYLHLGGYRTEWDSVLGYWWEYGEYYCFNISTPTDPSLVRYIDFGIQTDVELLESIRNVGFIGIYSAGSEDSIFYVSTCLGAQTLLGYNLIQSLNSADNFLVVSGSLPSGEWYISVWDASIPCALRLIGYYRDVAFPIECTIFRDTLFVLGYMGTGLNVYAVPVGTLGVQGRLDSSDDFDLGLYPNPTLRGVPVRTMGAGMVYDICGRNIMAIGTDGIVDTSKLKPGIYIILPKNGKPQKLVIIG